jgi:hypothetical protein
MNYLQLPNRHLRVNLRRRQLCMPKHRVDEPDIRPVFQHQRRHRVPEQVATARLN